MNPYTRCFDSPLSRRIIYTLMNLVPLDEDTCCVTPMVDLTRSLRVAWFYPIEFRNELCDLVSFISGKEELPLDEANEAAHLPENAARIVREALNLIRAVRIYVIKYLFDYEEARGRVVTWDFVLQIINAFREVDLLMATEADVACRYADALRPVLRLEKQGPRLLKDRTLTIFQKLSQWETASFT